jgi:hypothetical protein
MSFSELIGEKDVIRIHLPLTINKGFDAVGVRYGSGLFSEFRVRLGGLTEKNRCVKECSIRRFIS